MIIVNTFGNFCSNFDVEFKTVFVICQDFVSFLWGGGRKREGCVVLKHLLPGDKQRCFCPERFLIQLLIAKQTLDICVVFWLCCPGRHMDC